MREGFLKTANGKIWYAVYGEHLRKAPLLVLHGGPGFMSMSDGLESLWKERPVYFYDQLGCGRSDRAANKDFYSVENYISELTEVRSGLNLPEVYLMGFSWGCALASSYVLAKRPDGIKGIILSAPLLSTPAWDADQRRNIARMPANVRQAIEHGEATGDFGEAYQAAMMSYYRKHVCLLSPWPASLSAAFSGMSLDVYNTMWGPSEFTVTEALKDFDLGPRLWEINQPVLLTCGDRDEADVRTVKEFQERFPDARMAVIPQAAHLHQLEQPDIYTAVVKEFLRETE